MENVTILNVGHGDTKLTFDPTKPAERKRTQKIVADMLNLGYAICVKEGDRWVRATGFDPTKNEYLIKLKKGAKKGVPAVGRTRKIAAESTKSVAVARSAGGMSVQLDSVELQNLRSYDKFHPMRDSLKELADKAGEWAGIPMPLEDSPLVLNPTYPYAKHFEREITAEQKALIEKMQIRNRFFSRYYKCDVVIWEEEGKLQWAPDVHNKVSLELLTMGASYAWGIEQEYAALQTLAELIPHHLFKMYLLSGMFVETSKSSGISYIFRKLRPTLAMREKNGEMHILAALCMHPIGYYESSWSGAMCPTDDIISHLTLMRADEHMYWRRANQHPAYRPEAGV